MHKLLCSFLVAAALSSTALSPIALAATPAAADTALVEQALRCELGVGKAPAVAKALKRLGAKVDADAGKYTLPNPVRPFGLPVSVVTLNTDDIEIYFSVFPGGNGADIAKAAKLKPLGGDYTRDTQHGTLLTGLSDRTDAWLSCTVTR